MKIKDIKPALSEYIRDSVYLTGPGSLPDDKTIHDIRVLMKKSRATIKLASTLLDQETFTREYSAFRDVGSVLSQWRETSVQRKLLKAIRKKHPELMSQMEIDERISSLMRKTEPSSESSSVIKENFTIANEILRKSWYRIRFINPGIPDPEKMLKELDKSYGLAKECYIIARNNPKTANLHEFRKRSKDLLYQLYFFRPLKPRTIKNLEKQLDSMTQTLGKYNDVAMLIENLNYKYKQGGNITAMDEFVIILRHEQDRCLSKIWPSAYRIFSPGLKLMDVLGFSISVI